MKIAFNARILNTKQIRGWSRYAYNLIEGLRRRGVSVVLLSDVHFKDAEIPDSLHKLLRVKPGTNYFHWEQYVLPMMTKESGADILHCPINYGLPVLGSFKKVITIHDAIDRSYYEPLLSFSEKYSYPHLKSRILHSLSHKAADRVITVSEFSKRQIEKFYHIPRSKIDVIYEGAEDHFTPENTLNAEEILQRFHIRPGYYFYVGGLEKRKNIDLVLKAAKVLQPTGATFVIAGGKPDEFRTVAPSNVVFLGYVDDRYLPSLYSHSKAFVYASFEEGFGLQLVESMRLDRPAVYSNTSCLSEVYGSEDYSFCPDSVESLVNALKKIDNEYDKAVMYVRERKLFFSWNKTVNETIKVYEKSLL